MEPDPSKVQAVLDFPVPTTKKNTNTCIPGPDRVLSPIHSHYASLAVVPTDLTKKAAPASVQWTEACNKAFKGLKSILCSAPVLRSPDFDREFVLQMVPY